MKNESVSIPDVPESIIEKYFETLKIYKDANVEIPFDFVRTAFSNPLFFDVPDRGELLGKYVIVAGGTIKTLAGSSSYFPRRKALVVAHCHDRIVVRFEGMDYYVGWIEPHEYEVIDLIHKESSTCH